MMFNKLERRNNHIPNPSPFPVVTEQGRNTGAHIGAPLRRVLRVKKLNGIMPSLLLQFIQPCLHILDKGIAVDRAPAHDPIVFTNSGIFFTLRL